MCKTRGSHVVFSSPAGSSHSMSLSWNCFLFNAAIMSAKLEKKKKNAGSTRHWLFSARVSRVFKGLMQTLLIKGRQASFRMMRSLCRPEAAGTGSRQGCEVRISSSIFWQKQMRTRSHRQRDSCPAEEPTWAFFVACTAFPHLKSRQPPMQPKLLTQEGSREQFVGPDSAFSSPALFEC